MGKKSKASGQTPKRSRKLTYREERFVDEYLRTGNATQAAIIAGYSRVGARVQGHRLLTNANVILTIDAAREQAREKAKVERTDLLEKLIVIALGDPGDIIAWDDRGIRIKDYKKAGINRHMVESISRTDTPSEWGVSVTKQVKFRDKIKAIDELWKKLGFDKHNSGRDRQAFAATIRRALDRVKK